MRGSADLVRAAIWLVLLLSPVGAPLVGAIIISSCPADPSVVPSGPFAMGLSHCGVSRPIEHLYQHAVMRALLPIVFVGPIIGGILTAAWWLAAFGSAAACLWNLWRAAASVTIERL